MEPMGKTTMMTAQATHIAKEVFNVLIALLTIYGLIMIVNDFIHILPILKRLWT